MAFSVLILFHFPPLQLLIHISLLLTTLSHGLTTLKTSTPLNHSLCTLTLTPLNQGLCTNTDTNLPILLHHTHCTLGLEMAIISLPLIPFHHGSCTMVLMLSALNLQVNIYTANKPLPFLQVYHTHFLLHPISTFRNV